MAIKRITSANENLTNGRDRVEAQHYWAESHGKLVANNAQIKRYHHYFSVPEAYDNEPKPTYIGISMFWRDEPLALPPPPDPNRFFPVRGDDEHVFDRTVRWPTDDQHGDILGEENVIIDGPTKGSMINVIMMVVRKPGLDHKDFFDHWLNEHTKLAKQLPGLRRYIVCPVVLEYLARGTATHDGWSEFWFDDFWSFNAATKSPEWAAMEADGATLFAPEKGIVVGREYVQKDENWKPRDYGALSMSEDEIRARLIKEDYGHILQTIPDAPAKIKTAAQNNMLGVWTPEHLVTLDESRIDARPGRWPAWAAGYANEP